MSAAKRSESRQIVEKCPNQMKLSLKSKEKGGKSKKLTSEAKREKGMAQYWATILIVKLMRYECL